MKSAIVKKVCLPGGITKDGSDVSDEFIRYAKPLIQGEVQVPQQDGLPLFAYRK